jgi:hypothetical protein
MGISIRHAILCLLVISSVAVYLPHARGCGGACTIGGGSYDFLGDPAVNMDMSSPNDFVRENLGNSQTMLSTKSLSQGTPSNNSSSLNQTTRGNVSQNSSAALHVINGQGNSTSNNTTSDKGTSDSKIVKLGASGMQDKKLSTLAFTTFNNNMF